MKKIQYITPEIDVLDMELQSFITASGDRATVGFSDQSIEGDHEVGADEGGLFGTLE